MSGWMYKGDKRRLVETQDDMREAVADGYEVREPFGVASPSGASFSVENNDDVKRALAQSMGPEALGKAVDRGEEARKERQRGGTLETIQAWGEAGADQLTGGALSALSSPEKRARMRERREINPYASMAGGLTGALANPLTRGLAKGRGLIKGGAIEGAVASASEGVTDVFQSGDPVTAERVVSSVGGNFLYGGAVGGGVGLLGKAAQKGFRRAAAKIEDARLGKLGEAEDLSKLDRKGLRAARQTELENLEKARVVESGELPAEFKAHRAATLSDPDYQKIWKRLQSAEKHSPEASLLARWTKFQKKGRSFDNLIEKKAAAMKRGRVSSALTIIDEEAQLLDDLARAAPDLAEPVERMAARNAQLGDKVERLASKKYASPRLEAIEEARDSVSTKKSFLEQGVRAATLAGGTAALAPIAGAGAPLVASKLADIAGDIVGGRLAKAAGAASARSQHAIKAFLETAGKAARPAPVIAAKVLSAAQFAPSKEKPAKMSARKAYKARESEIRSQTMQGPKGIEMTPQARRELGNRLAPLAARYPLLADQAETTAARRISFLAEKLPKRPGMGMQVGPDTWEPSDFQVSQFARYVSATEDPDAILERMNDGSMTTEDVEALREVYPEIYNGIVTQIQEQLPTLRKNLPYEKRLMLSILFGVPVDPAMEPTTLDLLQGNFANEPNTEGGMTAPKPQPAFGSVSKPEPTAAQSRSA